MSAIVPWTVTVDVPFAPAVTVRPASDPSVRVPLATLSVTWTSPSAASESAIEMAFPLDVLNTSGAYQALGNATAQRTVATFATPVASQSATITFRQAIQNNDVLVAGEYAKTLTFSLSTTTP